MIPSVVHGWTVQRVTTTGFDGSFWVDGDKAVYVAGGEVFQYDGHQSTQISNTGGKAKECRASSGSIVWNAWDGHDLEMFLYQGGTTRQLTDNEVYDVRPDMSGSDVVWDTYEDSKIMLFDGSTTRELGTGYGARVSSGRVAWCGSGGADAEIFLYEGGTVRQLTDNEGINDLSPQVSDQYVMWKAGDFGGGYLGTICVNDGASTIELGRGFAPQLSGSKVVFATELSTGGDFVLNMLALWDGSSILQVPGTQGYLNLSPVFCGDGVAWVRLDPNESSEMPIQIMFYDGMSISSECITGITPSIGMLAEYVSRLATGEVMDIIHASPSMICCYGSNNDLYAAVVPEPSSISLMGVALLALGRIRNRIRKA